MPRSPGLGRRRGRPLSSAGPAGSAGRGRGRRAALCRRNFPGRSGRGGDVSAPGGGRKCSPGPAGAARDRAPPAAPSPLRAARPSPRPAWRAVRVPPRRLPRVPAVRGWRVTGVLCAAVRTRRVCRDGEAGSVEAGVGCRDSGGTRAAAMPGRRSWQRADSSGLCLPETASELAWWRALARRGVRNPVSLPQ